MKKRYVLPLVVTLLVLFTSLSFAVSKEITLAWDHDSVDLAGFKIYYGTSAGTYSPAVDVGMATLCSTLGITPEEFCHKMTIDIPDDATTTFYITASAYDAEANESAYASEVNVAYDYEHPPSIVDLAASFDKSTNMLSFNWSYETSWLTKIEKFSLWESTTAGTGYTKVVDIPYDPAMTTPYSTEVEITTQNLEETRYYVMTVHRPADNNSVSSVNSNEVTVVIDKMPPKSPFEFKIKIK